VNKERLSPLFVFTVITVISCSPLKEPITGNDPLKLLHKRAKEFVKQPPLFYYGLSPAQIPHVGGIFLITLKDENGEEPPKIISNAEFVAYMKVNCSVRFLTEPEIKERLALTVVISLQAKSLYLHN
jgi:hypothetical protein